jgi:phosphotransferase system enzyme I (PtsI)
MLKMVCEAAVEAKIPVSVCGEMAADPFHVPLLLGLGIRSLSMSAHSLPLIKRLIRRVRICDCEALVKESINLKTPDEVEKAVVVALKRWKKA